MGDTALRTGDLFFGYSDDMLGCKLEVALYDLKRSRLPERVHANDRTIKTNILCPAKSGCLFYCDACAYIWRNDTLAVFLALVLEQLPGRHTHHARIHTLSFELFILCNTEGNLAAGCKEQDIRFAINSVTERCS